MKDHEKIHQTHLDKLKKTPVVTFLTHIVVAHCCIADSVVKSLYCKEASDTA